MIVWFGRAEALDDPAKTEDFAKAYRALLDELSPVVDHMILVTPLPFGKPESALMRDLSARNGSLGTYAKEIREIGSDRDLRVVDLFAEMRAPGAPHLKDGGLQIAERGHEIIADAIARSMGAVGGGGNREALRQAVVAKNRLWFDYSRPQNWAFLGGDHEPADDHDHLNPEHQHSEGCKSISRSSMRPTKKSTNSPNSPPQNRDTFPPSPDHSRHCHRRPIGSRR